MLMFKVAFLCANYCMTMLKTVIFFISGWVAESGTEKAIFSVHHFCSRARTFSSSSISSHWPNHLQQQCLCLVIRSITAAIVLIQRTMQYLTTLLMTIQIMGMQITWLISMPSLLDPLALKKAWLIFLTKILCKHWMT